MAYNYSYQEQQQPSGDFQINSIDEFCPLHNVEYVAYDQETGETLCNGCIYDKKYDSLVFNAIVAKKLKTVYDEKFAQYKESLSKMQGISGDLITEQLKASMKNFFSSLKEELERIRLHVVNRLRNSKNLKELEDILHNAEGYFDEKKALQYRNEKARFDNIVHQGRFASICMNKNHFDQFIRVMDFEAEKLEKVCQDTEQKAKRVLKIRRDKTLIENKMNEIMDNCMEVDPGMPQSQRQVYHHQPPQRQHILSDNQPNRNNDMQQRSNNVQSQQINQQPASSFNRDQYSNQQRQPQIHQNDHNSFRPQSFNNVNQVQRPSQPQMQNTESASKLRIDLTQQREQAQQLQRQENTQQNPIRIIDDKPKPRQFARVNQAQNQQKPQAPQLSIPSHQMQRPQPPNQQPTIQRPQNVSAPQQVQRPHNVNMQQQMQQNVQQLSQMQRAQSQAKPVMQVQRPQMNLAQQHQQQQQVHNQQQQQVHNQQQQQVQQQVQHQNRQQPKSQEEVEMVHKMNEQRKVLEEKERQLAAQKMIYNKIEEKKEILPTQQEKDMFERQQERIKASQNQLTQQYTEKQRENIQMQQQFKSQVQVNEDNDQERMNQAQEQQRQAQEQHRKSFEEQRVKFQQQQEQARAHQVQQAAIQKAQQQQQEQQQKQEQQQQQQQQQQQEQQHQHQQHQQHQQQHQQHQQHQQQQQQQQQQQKQQHQQHQQQNQQNQKHHQNQQNQQQQPEKKPVEESKPAQSFITQTQAKIVSNIQTRPTFPTHNLSALSQRPIQKQSTPVSQSSTTAQPSQTSTPAKLEEVKQAEPVKPSTTGQQEEEKHLDTSVQPKQASQPQQMQQRQVPESQGAIPAPSPAVPTFESHFRTKAMSIMKVDNNGNSSNIYSLKDLFLPKNVYTTDQVMYVIGGAKDLKVKDTVTVCLEINFKNTPFRPVEKKPMSSARASFGCTISQDQNTIYVAGGYKTENEVFDKCEMYKRDEDTWYELPPMNQAKCSTGLCEFTSSNGKQYLYSFGGLWKGSQTKEVSLLNDIERLDLSDPFEIGWEKIGMSLPEKVCDVGVFQINPKSIMIYGGWNIKPLNNVHYFDADSDKKTIRSVPENEQLGKADFFLVNGTVGKSNRNTLLFSGHHCLHEYNPLTKSFKALGSSE